MGAKHSRIKRFVDFGNPPTACVAVTITRDRNSHVGILYRERDDSDEVAFLHLAFHHDLKNDRFDQTYLCVDPELEPEDAEMVAAHCRLIANDKPTIRFALHANSNARFGSRGGKMLLLKEGKGLNCSTFVMTVFNSAGPSLVDLTGWQKRTSDISWHKFLVALLKKKSVPAEYWRSVARDIGCARVRPEEIAGACMEESLPARFQECESNGQAVLNALVAHTGRTARTSWPAKL